MGTKQTKKCKHCETAIGMDPHGNEAWVHTWSGIMQCKSVATRKLMDSLAEPRPEK